MSENKLLMSDQAVREAVLTAADQVGVKLGDDAVAQVVGATQQALRDVIAEQQAEAALASAIRRQTTQFMRQCGIRPKIL
jgi:hypothetical protein